LLAVTESLSAANPSAGSKKKQRDRKIYLEMVHGGVVGCRGWWTFIRKQRFRFQRNKAFHIATPNQERVAKKLESDKVLP